jgi:hypothetical protein
MPLRRAGTVASTSVRYGPGSAAHRYAKNHRASKTRVNALMALRGVRARTPAIFRKSASFGEADFLEFDNSFAPLTFINHIETIP